MLLLTASSILPVNFLFVLCIDCVFPDLVPVCVCMCVCVWVFVCMCVCVCVCLGRDVEFKYCFSSPRKMFVATVNNDLKIYLSLESKTVQEYRDSRKLEAFL